MIQSITDVHAVSKRQGAHFKSTEESRNQEATLALLSVYVGSVEEQINPRETKPQSRIGLQKQGPGFALTHLQFLT